MKINLFLKILKQIPPLLSKQYGIKTPTLQFNNHMLHYL